MTLASSAPLLNEGLARISPPSSLTSRKNVIVQLETLLPEVVHGCERRVDPLAAFATSIASARLLSVVNGVGNFHEVED